MELGWSLPRRQAYINELMLPTTLTGRKREMKFQGRVQSFDIYVVPIEMPRYRLANGRTQAAQEEFLAKNSHLPRDYFERDFESDEVHGVQHQLLKEMLSNTGVNLLTYFDEQDQEEPIVLSSLGFVINGNRRLCTFRELYYKNRTKYERFKHVDVIILPPCNERDIDELEASLQIKREIKADYNWITKACMLRKRYQKHKYTYEELSKLYGMRQKDVIKSLDELAHVDAYLESREKPKEYELVLKDKYAFEQLMKCRKKVKSNSKKEIFTSVTYALIDSPKDGTGRLYQFIPDVADNIDKVVERIKLELNLLPQSDSYDNMLDLLGDDEEEEIEQLDLAIALGNPSYQEQIAEIVKDVIEEEKERKKDKNTKFFMINQLQKANTLLSDAVNCFDSNSSTKGVDVQLDEIEKSVMKLRRLLDDNVEN